MYFSIRRSLPARPEPDNTFWTDSTQDLFTSVLPQLKKYIYHPSGNLKFNYLGMFQSLKLRIIMEKFLLISLKLFTPNTMGCYGLWGGGDSCSLVSLSRRYSEGEKTRALMFKVLFHEKKATTPAKIYLFYGKNHSKVKVGTRNESSWMPQLETQ